MSFSHFQLVPSILKAINLCGYTAPTPIQQQAIPKALEGHDLIASAQTGTGKTAAFVLPALQRLSTPSTGRGKGPRVLVLTPTRELANQVTDATRVYGKFMRIKSGVILGGMPYFEQQRLLSQPVDMIVATPGRLIDHMERGRINFSRLELLVLDEADRMLDMGFSDAVTSIAAATPAMRQTLLFTATWDKTMASLAGRLMKEPLRIEIAGKKATLEQIDQRLHVADDMQHKSRMLNHIIGDKAVTRALVFSGTKRHADQLARELAEQGHTVEALHGDLSQNARNRAITKMRQGRVRVLVATDVAARGIDVIGISHVINYDLPKNAEDYVHRIGRTGRAGASGIAISFVSGRELDLLNRIERFIGQAVPRFVIPGLEPKYALRPVKAGVSAGRPAAFAGRRTAKPGSFSKPGASTSGRRSRDASGYSRDETRRARKEGGKAADYGTHVAKRKRSW